MTIAPLSSREATVRALEVEAGPGRTRRKVGRPEARLASATNRPMNPVEPTTRVRPLAATGAWTVIFQVFLHKKKNTDKQKQNWETFRERTKKICEGREIRDTEMLDICITWPQRRNNWNAGIVYTGERSVGINLDQFVSTANRGRQQDRCSAAFPCSHDSIFLGVLIVTVYNLNPANHTCICAQIVHRFYCGVHYWFYTNDPSRLLNINIVLRVPQKISSIWYQ